jgi:hypothetical protein
VNNIFGENYKEGDKAWLSLYSAEWEPVVDNLFGDFTSEKAFRMIHRLNLETFQKHKNWRDKIPHGYTMERVDAQSYDSFKSLYPNFQWRGGKPKGANFRWFLINDSGEEVGDCSSVWVESVGVETDCVEIGIGTLEPYRRNGFAVLTASAFIEDCLSKSLIPVWCCWDFREGSKELADNSSQNSL